MFSIVFYKDRRGREPVKEYLEKLNASAEHNKEHRAKLKKIYEYLGVLSSTGTRAGMPYVKHIGASSSFGPHFLLLVERRRICLVASFYQEVTENAP